MQFFVRSTRKAAFAIAGAAAVATLWGGSVAASELPRDHVVLASALRVDADTNTVVLPLFNGTVSGKAVYYIITESSNQADAAKRGLNYAPHIGAAFTQAATGSEDGLAFAGAPDFSPARTYTPSATGFPPASAAPGAVGDDAYSPFVKLSDGTTLNAPIVATGNGPFDVTTHANTAARVLAIDPAKKTVTLLLAHGFFNGSHVVYLSTEASDAGAAAIERATYVKNLATSGPASRIAIVALANGQTGKDNPNAQGLAHLALDENLSSDAVLGDSANFGSPLNILATFPTGPTAAGYRPLWDANVGVWSKAAVAAGENVKLTSASQAYDLSSKGSITTPDGKPLAPVGFVVNCPVVGYVDKAP